MATLKSIKGFSVQTLPTDTVASQLDTGAWTSAASMNTARIASTGTGSASTNYIIAGGYYLPPTVDRSVTEQYNGTAWTEVADCPQDLTYGNGLGSGTSSLLCSYSQPGPAPGGYGPTTATHIWNGSSWSTVNSMNTFRQNAGTAGSTTAGLIFGGTAPGANANTESWDGTNWTEVADLNTAKSDIGGGCGVQTAALSASGSPVTTEQWDGSSWTEVTDINTPRQNSCKAGLYNSALCISGQNPSTYLANVEAWDGTAWTEVSDVATARAYVGGMSPTGSAGSSDAIIAGGSGASLSAATEVWTTSSSFTKQNLGQVYYNSGSNAFKVTRTVLGTGAWASGGNMSTTRAQASSAGTQTAALVAGGAAPPSTGTANSEEYNGSAWAEGNNLNNAIRLQVGRGTQTSALSMAGYTTTYVSLTESYNGTSWTNTGHNVNTARSQAGAGGTSNTSGIFFGGENPSSPYISLFAEVYDGSSWTEVGDLNSARTQVSGSGTATSAVAAAGHPGSGYTTDVELWDGTSWTETTNLNTGLEGRMGFGTDNTSAFVVGGRSPYQGITEQWNGSSWTEVADMASARYNGSGMGSPSSGLIAGGSTSGTSGSVTTEEWTVPATVTNQTITVG